MNKNIIKLKSCPVCNCKDAMLAEYLKGNKAILFWCECPLCFTRTKKYSTRTLAIEEWNNNKKDFYKEK